MKKMLFGCGLICSFSMAYSQNVGIGTNTPTDAKLQVENAGSSTQAMFSNGTVGLSILVEQNRPSIGMNTYYSGGYKFKGAGFASLFYYRPTTGALTYYSSSVSGAAGGAVSFTDILHLQADGNIGIGTTTPTEAKLQVHEPAGNTQFIAAAGNNLPGISVYVPSSAPTLGFNSRYQSGYKFMGAGYSSFLQFSPTNGALNYYNSSTKGVADGSINSSFAFSVDSNGYMGLKTSTPKAPLHVNGNVVFGTSSISPATGYRLSVDGKIICEELKVQLSGSWPDYVFESDYPLMPLQLLQQQVMDQKHLPGIPAASVVQSQNGIEMGDMQKRILEKVEELYRYTFELNNKNIKLEEKIAALELELKKRKN